MATCTAPGHPGCTITCPKGCMALFIEPNGPCHTRCTKRGAEPLALDAGQRFSVQINEMQSDELLAVLGESLSAALVKKLSAETRLVSAALQDATVDDLENAIANQLA